MNSDQGMSEVNTTAVAFCCRFWIDSTGHGLGRSAGLKVVMGG